MNEAIPTAAKSSLASPSRKTSEKATPSAPPDKKSGTNIALTPPEPSEKSVATSFATAKATRKSQPWWPAMISVTAS